MCIRVAQNLCSSINHRATLARHIHHCRRCGAVVCNTQNDTSVAGDWEKAFGQHATECDSIGFLANNFQTISVENSGRYRFWMTLPVELFAYWTLFWVFKKWLMRTLNLFDCLICDCNTPCERVSNTVILLPHVSCFVLCSPHQLTRNKYLVIELFPSRYYRRVGVFELE